MSEDTKKNKQKAKSEPKEQRRRRGRQHAAPIEKKIEKEPETRKGQNETTNSVAVPEKPAYEPPPPEFYKNLKRETDEILKITEEANTKYKKKEIQSNWAKYEMPIESYEEIDEQENLGADYEALIQAPLTVGAHFQFKHEKSWDITTGPSPYDKYFDINMDTLNIALSTIPFNERNSIDSLFFNESDMQSMSHRATKFKQKYYKDKKFTTPDLVAQERMLNSLKSEGNDDNYEALRDSDDKMLNQFKDIKLEDCEKESEQAVNKEVVLDNKEEEKPIEPKIVSPEKPILANLSEDDNQVNNFDKEIVAFGILEKDSMELKENNDKNISIKTVDNDYDGSVEVKEKNKNMNKSVDNGYEDFVEAEVNNKDQMKVDTKVLEQEVRLKPVDIVPKETELPKMPKTRAAPTKNPIIESPEDLEKWLDDFLDG